jgi:hypothetical protein
MLFLSRDGGPIYTTQNPRMYSDFSTLTQEQNLHIGAFGLLTATCSVPSFYQCTSSTSRTMIFEAVADFAFRNDGGRSGNAVWRLGVHFRKSTVLPISTCGRHRWR